MNVKRLLFAALAVFVTFQVFDFVIHNLLLSADYEASMDLWRPNMMEMMWLNYLASIILSLFFSYIFAKGYQGKGVLEGVWFGVIFGIGYHLVNILSQYFVYPIPLVLMVKWLIFGFFEFVIVGIVVSLVYKSK